MSDFGVDWDFDTSLYSGGGFGDVSTNILSPGDFSLDTGGGLSNLPTDWGGGMDLSMPDSGGATLPTGDYNLSGGEMPTLSPNQYALPAGPTGTGMADASSPGGGSDITRGVYDRYSGNQSGPYSPNPTVDVGATASSGSNALSDWWNSDNKMGSLSNIAKEVLPIAQLGMAGLGAAQGIYGAIQSGKQGQIVSQAQKRQGQIAESQQGAAKQAQDYASPIFQGGADATARALRGEVPGGVEAQIQEWRRGALQLARDQMARSGGGSSSQLASWEAWIERQATSMRGAWIKDQLDYGLKSADTGRGLLNTGVTALSGAGSTSQQQGDLARQQQDSLNKLLQEANATLARLNASGAK